jgi:hypothetical protein
MMGADLLTETGERDSSKSGKDVSEWMPNPYAERYARGPVIKPREPKWSLRYLLWDIKYLLERLTKTS